MFSGRWEDSLERDKDGAIFFDFNPQYFLVILDYLRAKKIATPENPAPLPKVAEDQAKSFNNLLEYLGLSDEIVPAEKVPIARNSIDTATLELLLRKAGQLQFMVQIMALVMFWEKMFTNKALFVSR
jgi:hypothetical protein